MVPIIEADAAKIGITFTVRSINGAYPTIQTPVEEHPDRRAPELGQGLRRPVHVLRAAVRRPARSSQVRQHELLARRHHAGRCKTRRRDRQPRRTSRASTRTSRPAAPSWLRTAPTCWESLDKKLMTTVVPWVPYLWPNNVFIIGPNVTHWNFDQFTDGPAYSSVAGQAVRKRTEGAGRSSRPSSHRADLTR